VDAPGRKALDERRASDRQDCAGPVAVRFVEAQLVGPGANNSSEGVFFVAQGAVRVQVRLGDGEWREGELVRAQSMGEGKVGLAVRFV
jgi:hypothetical protein